MVEIYMKTMDSCSNILVRFTLEFYIKTQTQAFGSQHWEYAYPSSLEN